MCGANCRLRRCRGLQTIAEGGESCHGQEEEEEEVVVVVLEAEERDK